MDGSIRGPASFATQADALFRKNLTFQKRNWRTNICLTIFPVIICVLILVLQNLVNSALDKPETRCGCNEQQVCGLQYSTSDQAVFCPIPSPPKWPTLLQIPRPEFRAVAAKFTPFSDLPSESCRRTQSCPATVLFTGGNRSLAERLSENLFISTSSINSSTSSINSSDFLSSISGFILGTDTEPGSTEFIEPAFTSDSPLYMVQPQCLPNFSVSVPIQLPFVTIQKEVKCIQGLSLWRDSSLVVNDELFKGYQHGNAEKKLNEIVAAYDFLNSNDKNYNVNIWYNSTYSRASQLTSNLLRIPRSINMASNAYLRFLKGTAVKMQLEFVNEMPKPATELRLDVSSILGTLFFVWIIQLPFPVILTYLVYEKQQRLKIMMKMHGLGDGPYWTISYVYFLLLSSVYILCFVIFGSIIGLKFFRLNDYGIQFVFYFFYINLQIAFAFFMATNFSYVKTATVMAYIYVFGSGLLGEFLLRYFVQDESFSRRWILLMEIIPGFSLYRGIYELSEYAFSGNYMGTSGMRWTDLRDNQNGMKDVLIIMIVDWLVLLPVACYLDRIASFTNGIRNVTLTFLSCSWMKRSQSFHDPSLKHEGSEVSIGIEKPDISQERKVVEHLLLEPCTSNAIVCDNLRKVYPGKDGNPEKLAVRGLSLALPRGECFGMLGPNGAGKTSVINMLTGLSRPTSGTAFVQGMDIRVNMDKIYTGIGVCPQHDLLWETLTGKEHLLFYGRLKNLQGAALAQAVEESLKSVNLFYGGVGDKQAGKYSGGMKRRLTVAISLIGDPKVVYMDEPSTGLDPASRSNLWNVVKRAKQDRAIILTTHSMEEAEVLCDRLGIFVDGSLQCIGNPKELKARYGGFFILTLTTSPNEEEEVEAFVRRISPSANKIYHISGTQKFELPKQEAKIVDIFQAVEDAKSKLTIHAWGLADTTLEDVFIKVAKGAKSFNVI